MHSSADEEAAGPGEGAAAENIDPPASETDDNKNIVRSAGKVKAPYAADEAIAFLHLARGKPGEDADGKLNLWVLGAIPQSGGAPEVSSFDDEEKARDWLETKVRARRNLYFTAGITKDRISRKPKKTDMAGANLCWVDRDPPKLSPADVERLGPEGCAEHYDAENDKIRAGFENPPAGVPKPTIIANSGNGHQAFWPLDRELPLEEIEAINRWLCKQFGAGVDPAWSGEHLMRLIGTPNLPTEKKRKVGKTRVMDSFVHFADPMLTRLSPDLFGRAEVQQQEQPKGDAPAWDSNNLPVIGKLADLLPGKEHAALHQFIETGINPDKEYPSRSEALLGAVRMMHNAGLEPPTIIAIIIEPRFKISESVVERRGGVEAWKKYAIKEVGAVLKTARAEEPEIFFAHNPRPIARAFSKKLHEGDGPLRWRGDSYVWNGRCWAVQEDDGVRSDMGNFQEGCQTLNKKGDTVPFTANTYSVSQALDALRAIGHINADKEVPHWRNGAEGPPATELISFTNGTLHVPTMELLKPDKNLFSVHALDCDYDPTARAPQFENFMSVCLTAKGAEPDQDTEDSISLIEEFMGLCMVDDTRYQKGLMMLGPPRSGRGTLLRVVEQVVGANNYTGASTQQFSGEFGLQPLIGKLVAGIADARTGGRIDIPTVVERLLNIIGEDSIPVNRKNKVMWEGKLPTRIIFVSNELPKFVDASGAIATRFVLAQFKRTFLGEEDLDMTDKLLTELPGIVNLAIAGLARLRRRRRFKMAQSGQALMDALLRTAQTVRLWVDDRAELDVNGATPTAAAYADYKGWCDENGLKPKPSNTFGQDLQAAFPLQVTPRKITLPGDKEQTRCYVGLRIRGGEEVPDGGGY
jgi:P4 family phage/plasmid primase-like protien